jgi:hypothetical protein
MAPLPLFPPLNVKTATTSGMPLVLVVLALMTVLVLLMTVQLILVVLVRAEALHLSPATRSCHATSV